MALQGCDVAVAGHPAAAKKLEGALKEAGARPLSAGPVDYVFYVSAPSDALEEADIALLLERVDQSGGRLRHVCLVSDPARGEPATPEEVRPLAVEDGLRYLAGLHGVPLAVVAARPGAAGWELAAIRAAAERLTGTVDAGRKP